MKLLKAVFICLALFSFSQAYCGELQTVLNTAEEYNGILAYSDPEPFTIYDTGTEEWIDYEQYGTFSGIGSETYEYTPRSLEVLAAASGEGIYPNTESVLKSPGLAEYLKKNRLKVSKLKAPKYNKIKAADYEGQFYRWSLFDDNNQGVTFFLAADALEKAGNYKHAVKAYYACLIFFPRAFEYTQWKTPWYIAPACFSRINHLTREHPEIGVRLEGCDITIKNVYDNDIKNDIFIINPGKLVPSPIKNKDFEKKTKDMSKAAVKKTTGVGKVKLLQYKNGHFALTVNNKPYIVKGVSYSPSKIGLSPDFGTLNNLRDWSVNDYDKNGQIDGAYDAWVDANRNEKQDKYEVNVGDFALMKEMGANTIRIYHYDGVNQDLLQDGYETYGFMYMIGNLIGMYAIDSGADWYSGTDYTDEKQKKAMLESVKRMVLQYRDKPYVLTWVLGNENNYGSVSDGTTSGSGCQAQAQPEAYYKFANECAKLIKSLDPNRRPVTICNGDAYFLDYCSKYAPDIDIYGANVYRGEAGVGLLWKDIAREYSKPVLITEFGCPAYAKGWNVAKREYKQAMYHKGNWIDIEYNTAGVAGGTGNALGGVVFEWTDEWWKSGYMFSADEHDTESQWFGPFLDGRAYEEWFGVCSLGNGEDSPFKRQLRKVYFMYRDLWKGK